MFSLEYVLLISVAPASVSGRNFVAAVISASSVSAFPLWVLQKLQHRSCLNPFSELPDQLSANMIVSLPNGPLTSSLLFRV